MTEAWSVDPATAADKFDSWMTAEAMMAWESHSLYR